MEKRPQDFQALLLEGTFYTDESRFFPDSRGVVREGSFPHLMCKSFQGPVRSLYEDLKVFTGHRIRLVLQHVPPMPPDMEKWGGGCCLWETFGRCPFGHHADPHKLLNYPLEGILVFDADHNQGSGGWWIEGLDGSRTMVPFVPFLSGHVGRVAGATLLDVERMRESICSSGDLNSVEGLGERIGNLRDLVSRIREEP